MISHNEKYADIKVTVLKEIKTKFYIAYLRLLLCMSMKPEQRRKEPIKIPDI